MKKKVIWPDKLWIVTGPVRSGKTTQLQQWAEGRDVAGFLTPDIDGVRCFYDLASGQKLPFQIERETGEPAVHVGRFAFLGSVFERGKQMIIDSFSKSAQYFIIDEFGKLEMDGRGFGPAVDQLMARLSGGHTATTYIIVVRDYLLTSFLDKYHLATGNE